MFHKCTFSLFRASSRGWTWMRSCMWAVTPTTQSSPKLLALRVVLSVRHRSVYTSREKKSTLCEILIWYCYYAGCIRQLVIQGEEVIFKNFDFSATGVTNCPTCKDHPCQVSHIHPLDVFAIFGMWVVCFIISVSSMLLFRMEGLVRTRRPACTSAAAPEDSQEATASTTHPCTVTQVQPRPDQQIPALSVCIINSAMLN